MKLLLYTVIVFPGLCTLIGIIIYISAITEEAGSKPKSSIDDQKFFYYYGPSFAMTVGSFISSELTGVLSVYLYIVRYKSVYRKKQERLTVVEPTNDRPRHSYHRPTSRENSRGVAGADHTSLSHYSDTYYTYMPVSETKGEGSNYALSRAPSRQTLPCCSSSFGTIMANAPDAATAGMHAVDAQVHVMHSSSRERSSTLSIKDSSEAFRRTTLVWYDMVMSWHIMTCCVM